MKGKASGVGLLVMAKPKGDVEDEELEAGDEDGAGKVDNLLGNAFDAFADEDREGFVKSMRAVLKLCAKEE